MPPLKSLMATRPRACRKLADPKTPEPFAEADAQPPSRPRFRLRRRNAAQREAPTQQFLASVAAADVPIPSIEEPRLADEEMLTTPEPMFAQFSQADSNLLNIPHWDLYERAASPKTPAPCAIPSPMPQRFPDWSVDQAYSSLDSSPECDSSRPSTAQSTQTSASLFSRYSVNSDNFSQFSIDADEFGGSMLPMEDADKTIKATNPKAAATLLGMRSRKAPWTRAMSQHLWSTYMIYLQDPHVTPFRVSKAGIPPQGVCMRVARETKRSWKGSKPQTRVEAKSASATPTVTSATSYVQWPHSCAVTRAHLRDLCRISAGSRSGSTARHHPYLTHRAAPFGRTAAGRGEDRRSTPLLSPKTFSGSDMALSLAVSTCESMQPLGPLAQLTASEGGPSADTGAATVSTGPVVNSIKTLISEEPIARLGSPFMAKSYGPSSSSRPMIKDVVSASLEPRRKSHSVEVRRGLRSPAKLSTGRGSTQKRRSRPSVLEPRRKRPSLSLDTWTAPPPCAVETVAAEAPFADFSSQRDTLLVPRANIQELFETPRNPLAAVQNAEASAVRLEPAEIPRRLGSPFAAVRSSFSFPNRSSSISGLDFGVIRRPFATSQRPADANTNTNTNTNTTPTKTSSLRSRLAYIDERLKDFRRRDHSRRRSRSPL